MIFILFYLFHVFMCTSYHTVKFHKDAMYFLDVIKDKVLTLYPQISGPSPAALRPTCEKILPSNRKWNWNPDNHHIYCKYLIFCEH